MQTYIARNIKEIKWRYQEYFYDNNMYDLHEVYKFLEKHKLSNPA